MKLSARQVEALKLLKPVTDMAWVCFVAKVHAVTHYSLAQRQLIEITNVGQDGDMLNARVQLTKAGRDAVFPY